MAQFVIGTVGNSLQAPQALGRLRRQIDPFIAIPWSVKHPKDGNYRTFALQEVGDGSYGVATSAFLGLFDAAHKSNLLYFREPLPADAVFLVDETNHYLGGSPLWYTKTTIEDLTSCASSVTVQNRLGCHLYRQVEQRPAGPVSRLVIRMLPNMDRADAWMNPALLQLDLDGSEAALDDEILRPFVDTDNALFVEPLLDTDDELRGAFWRELLASRIQQGTPPSLFEALFIGPCSDEGQSTAFLALDVLRGIFQIDARHSPASFAWSPGGRGLPPNAAEYAKYWLRRWHGKFVASPPAEQFRQQLAASEKPHPRFTETFDIETSRYSACAESAGAMLDVLRAQTGTRSASVDLIANLLRQPALQGRRADGYHQGHYDVQSRDKVLTVHLDLVSFLDRLTREQILPRSRVWITLPAEPKLLSSHPRMSQATLAEISAAFAGKYIDLATSVRLGGYEVLRRLASRNASRPPLSAQYAYGWWADWYDWMFCAGPQDSFTLHVPPTGFTLNQSSLGSARLGWSGQVTHQSRCIHL